MLEKYTGRKKTPPLEIDNKEPAESVSTLWWKRVTKDPAFMDWFSGSVVTDSLGDPIPVYHSTRGNLSFEAIYRAGADEMGVHFGSAEAANERLKDNFDSVIKDLAHTNELMNEYSKAYLQLSPHITQEEVDKEVSNLERNRERREEVHRKRISQGFIGGEKIYPVFLRIINPVRIKDPGSFSEDTLKSIKKDLVQNFVTRDQVKKIKSAGTIDNLRKALIGLGYDGVVYKNSVEGRGSDSYIPIVDANQIKSVFSIQPNEAQ